jgi:hypothetical protein
MSSTTTKTASRPTVVRARFGPRPVVSRMRWITALEIADASCPVDCSTVISDTVPDIAT